MGFPIYEGNLGHDNSGHLSAVASQYRTREGVAEPEPEEG